MAAPFFCSSRFVPFRVNSEANLAPATMTSSFSGLSFTPRPPRAYAPGSRVRRKRLCPKNRPPGLNPFRSRKSLPARRHSPRSFVMAWRSSKRRPLILRAPGGRARLCDREHAAHHPADAACFLALAASRGEGGRNVARPGQSGKDQGETLGGRGRQRCDAQAGAGGG